MASHMSIEVEQRPKRNLKASFLILVVLLAIAAGCMFVADRVQRDNGRVAIEDGYISTDCGDVAYKLYIPPTATPETPAPGVLLLHGYQNDHETNAAYAIELARRGYVALSIDCYGHGATKCGLTSRGYVNHVVKVNYGNDSEADGTFVQIGGPTRYRILMNFSNLSFFDDHYTRDAEGNDMRDTTVGGASAYAYLASLPYVDATRLALTGHSMGTWSSWSVAAAFANSTDEAGKSIAPKAIVLQCGELFRQLPTVYDVEHIHFNNVLLLQAKYDEFSYFRDYQLNVTDDLLKTPLRYEFLGTTAEGAAWDKTFGTFADGTARRIELLNTNHRLTTHNRHGLATALEWFGTALDHQTSLAPTDQVAMIKECLVLTAMLASLFAMLPLLNLLLAVPIFNPVQQGLPDRSTLKGAGSWIFAAFLTIVLSAASFPFMTQLGHGLLPLPENIFKMTVGNGFVGWYLTLIVIMLVTTALGVHQAHKRGERYNLQAVGLSSGAGAGQTILMIIEALILAVLMAGMVYGLNYAFYRFFGLDLRFIWPFFRTVDKERAMQFLIYIPIFALFYVLNNSKIMAGERTAASYHEGFGWALIDWFKNFVLMAGGILCVVALEYIPFFLGIGPGADVYLGSTFGGPFMSILILFVPQVLFFSVSCTYCYRKTGNVYTGAFLAAILACWIVTGGSTFL